LAMVETWMEGNKIRALMVGTECHMRYGATPLLARSAVPVVAVRTVLRGACGNSFFRVWVEVRPPHVGKALTISAMDDPKVRGCSKNPAPSR